MGKSIKVNNLINRKKAKAKEARKRGNPQPRASFEAITNVKLAKSVALPRQPQPSGGVTSKLTLSECALKYALAIADPFNPAARGACVPVFNGNTMKSHAYARFDGAFDSAGNCFVYVMPCLASDCVSLLVSGSTNTSGNVPWSSFGTSSTSASLNTGWSEVKTNGSITLGQLFGTGSSFVTGKVVAAGLRAQYTGTELNKSGLFYCFHDPAHRSVYPATTALLGSNSDVTIEGVTRDPCTLSLHAVKSSELSFPAQNNGIASNNVSVNDRLYPFSSGETDWSSTTPGAAGSTPYLAVGSTYYAVGAPVGVIQVSGGVSGQSIHFEYVVHAEYQGAGVGALVTTNPADMDGAMRVMTAASQMGAALTAEPHKSRWQVLRDLLVKGAKQAAKLSVPLLEGAVSSMLLM